MNAPDMGLAADAEALNAAELVLSILRDAGQPITTGDIGTRCQHELTPDTISKTVHNLRKRGLVDTDQVDGKRRHRLLPAADAPRKHRRSPGSAKPVNARPAPVAVRAADAPTIERPAVATEAAVRPSLRPDTGRPRLVLHEDFASIHIGDKAVDLSPGSLAGLLRLLRLAEGLFEDLGA